MVEQNFWFATRPCIQQNSQKENSRSTLDRADGSNMPDTFGQGLDAHQPGSALGPQAQVDSNFYRPCFCEAQGLQGVVSEADLPATTEENLGTEACNVCFGKINLRQMTLNPTASAPQIISSPPPPWFQAGRAGAGGVQIRTSYPGRGFRKHGRDCMNRSAGITIRNIRTYVYIYIYIYIEI